MGGSGGRGGQEVGCPVREDGGVECQEGGLGYERSGVNGDGEDGGFEWLEEFGLKVWRLLVVKGFQGMGLYATCLEMGGLGDR